MAFHGTHPYSRRAIIAASLGGLVASVAAALGRPGGARATDGGSIILGSAPAPPLDGSGVNEASGTTAIYTNNGYGLKATSNSGIGLAGYGSTDYGVHGTSDTNAGVHGESVSGYGVAGNSSSSVGVRGYSELSAGVFGDSSNSLGVRGRSYATGQPATASESLGNSTGVLGYSGGGTFPAARAKTGVYGYAAQDSASRGVYGQSPAGHGVHGKTSTGYAGYFEGRVYTTKFFELTEISTPAKPSANRARLFVRESSGKAQLCVKFANGRVRVLATQ
jgi:hypothetical protein